MMHCILSGFDPFGGAEANPSQQAVERVGENLTLADGSPVAIRKLVLPTSSNNSWKLLREAVGAIPAGEPFALVMSGLAETRDAIMPEWYALNVRHYRIADNQGHQPARESIVADGPEALKPTVQLEKLLGRLSGSGLRADISYHAGTFVCNEIYYRALNEWGSDPRCMGIVFIHLPEPGKYKTKVAEQARDVEPLEDYMTALVETCRFICGGRV
jgi:pyroglutamyl-peptidase